MDFSLNDEQKLFQQATRQYLDSLGHTQLARRYMDGDDNVLNELWEGLSELGYFGIAIAEEYGGLGLDSLSLVPIMEEMGRALTPGTYPETVALAAPILEKYGTKEQKERYLPEIVAGKQSFTLAFLEPDGSFEAEDIQMEGQLVDDCYIVNGVKTMVPFPNNPGTLIVPIRTKKSNSTDGISLLLVDTSEPGLNFEMLQNMDQTRKLAKITFSNVRIPTSQLLGLENHGWGILQEGFKYLNVALSAMMVGGMDKVVEMSVEHGKNRIQFGQPIGRFQAIKHRIVDMKRDLESARSLTYYAAWALANQMADTSAAIYSARAFVTEAFIQAAGHNIQNHGGMGYTWEFDCHLYLKHARALENYLGSPQDYRELTVTSLESLSNDVKVMD